MLNSESIVIIQIKGEHLLYSKISGGMIGYGWGNVCYIVFFSPGKYLLYSTVSGGKFYYIANIPRGNVYYSVGRFAMRKVYYTTPALIFLWCMYQIRKVISLWATLVSVSTLLDCCLRGNFVCLFFNFARNLSESETKKVTSNLKATHLESHTAI